MRILFAITRSDAVGGASIHVRDMSRALRDRGHDARVLIGGTGEVARQIAANRVPIYTMRHLHRSLHGWRDAAALQEIVRCLRRWRPDLISAHTSKAGWLLRLVGQILRVPVIYTPHCWSFADGFPHAGFFRMCESIAAPLSTRIVCVSGPERDLAIRHRVSWPQRLVVIHNGMPDISPDQRARPGRCPPRLTMIGRFEEQKDHSTLCRALARLRHLDWSARLIGDGPRMGATQALVQDLGLADRIEFSGYSSNVVPSLAASEVFALITHWESFPRSILEAMRAGLPVIATDVGGVAESVEHGRNGFLVPRGNVDALVEQLERTIASSALRVRFGAESRRRYEERFTFDHMLEQYLQLYRDLLGIGRKVPAGAGQVNWPKAIVPAATG